MEEWRSIFDGFYEVSNLGNVRRAKPGTSTFVGRPVQPIVGATGYAQVQLSAPHGSVRAYVHRLVALAFLGPCPDGHVVNHVDANKQNNRLANLEYVSSRENVMHAVRTVARRRGPTKPKLPPKGRPTGDAHWSRRAPERVARGEKMGGSKLTEQSVRAMHARRANGTTVQAIADEFGISLGQTSRILRGERWAHVK
jgi:hypothetical protein